MPDTAKLVFHGAVFDVYQWQQLGYDGVARTFEKLRRPDTVACIPVTADGKIILTREQQPRKDPFVSLAGGRVEDGEDPLAAAKRELLEETGYSSDDWSLFSALQVTSKIDWAVYVFVARGCKKVAAQSLDGAEKIDLVLVSPDEFFAQATDPSFDYQELKVKILEAKLDPEKMATLKNQLFMP